MLVAFLKRKVSSEIFKDYYFLDVEELLLVEVANEMCPFSNTLCSALFKHFEVLHLMLRCSVMKPVRYL